MRTSQVTQRIRFAPAGRVSGRRNMGASTERRGLRCHLLCGIPQALASLVGIGLSAACSTADPAPCSWSWESSRGRLGPVSMWETGKGPGPWLDLA